MTPADFEHLAELVKTRSGIVLTPEKTYLMNSRLTPVARKYSLDGVGDLVKALKSGANAASIETDIVEAMTTNESFFFRDTTPFDIFRDIMLPHILQARAAKKSFRIWCAAASAGQEPYSLSMILKEHSHKLPGWRHEIVGTDISEEILEKARTGLYSQFEVQRGLPITLLAKYFEKQGDLWQVNAALRAMVQYRKFNLLDRFQGLGQFDIVFCRNVLIYFDRETKADILARIAAQMPADGFLILGAAETVIGITDVFEPVKGSRGLYRRAGTAAAAPAGVAAPRPATAGLATARAIA
ncbi:Chemotaxis protein methyltransferase CheR [hydrothermal vent metagenome]|uniref:protein-glutamate O-methyltransferase n=1 Tax=hydrothermal vent metagenome TaxID=652676 RepID=A0A3B0TH40_9ZZZZ